MKLSKRTKERLLSVSVRVFALVCTAVACYANILFMENLGKNPLASVGIWGMAAAVGISFSVIYLINDNKAIDKRKTK